MSKEAQKLVQAARRRKCAGCGRQIVKGEYALVRGRKAYCLRCASSIVSDPALSDRIKLLLREKIDAYLS